MTASQRGLRPAGPHFSAGFPTKGRKPPLEMSRNASFCLKQKTDRERTVLKYLHREGARKRYFRELTLSKGKNRKTRNTDLQIGLLPVELRVPDRRCRFA